MTHGMPHSLAIYPPSCICLDRENPRLKRGCEGVRGGDDKTHCYGTRFCRRCDYVGCKRSGPRPDTRASLVDVSWRQPARPAAKPGPHRISGADQQGAVTRLLGDDATATLAKNSGDIQPAAITRRVDGKDEGVRNLKRLVPAPND